MKKYIMPICVGLLSSIIPTYLGYSVCTFEYWIWSLAIIIYPWIVIPIHYSIQEKDDYPFI